MTSAGGLTILLLLIAASCATVNSLVPENFDTCGAQKLLYPSIRCQDDGSFSSLQCEDDRCWCVHRNGTRFNQMTFPRTDDASDATCANIAICPIVRCSKEDFLRCGALGFAVNDIGCFTCGCRARCRPSILELQAVCGLRCIGHRDNCPYCREGCNSTEGMNVCMCSGDQVCVREGFGEATCRDRLTEDATCVREVDEEGEDDVIEDDSRDITDSLATSEEEDEEQREEKERARGLLVGTSARHAAFTLDRATIGCSRNEYCKRVGLTISVCAPRSTDGPCSSNETAVMGDECDSNGFFKPRICRPGPREGTLICACVFPTNGTRLSEVLVDQRSNDVALSRRPTCISIVYESCTVNRLGRNINVQHGDTFVDTCGCTYCKCYQGRLRCTKNKPVCKRNCIAGGCELADGSRLRQGHSIDVGCNRCKCLFGALRCTERDCDDENTTNNTCSQCSQEQIQPVCGRNGRTYPSRCAAIHCAGIPSIDIIDAPCPVINPCDVFPCEDGEVCRRKAGSYCLTRQGCKPNTVRVCVNITQLSCDDYNTTTVMDSEEEFFEGETNGDIGSGDVEPSDTRVCGTDGITYGSACELLQRTADIDVHYAGPCNATNCRGGQVCGTDGITYDNICVLRSRSNGARVDYSGPCEEEETPQRICDAVNRGERCGVRDITNCRYLVKPSVGCCPICGGVLIMALDLDRLADAADIDGGLGTLDGFMVRLVQDTMFKNLQGRCVVEASLTETNDLEIIFHARNSSDEADAMFCHEQVVAVAEVVNGDSSVSSSSFQFVAAASIGARSTTDPNGAGTLSALSLLALTITAALVAVFM